jgi:hypothetical protein
MRNHFYKFLIVAALLPFQSCSLFTGTDDELTEVTLRGIILPGKTDQNENIVVKYSWQGGGCLRSIEDVMINQHKNQITLTPLGKLITGVACPADIFHRIETVSLGRLNSGTYTVTYKGKSTYFTDDVIIPKAAPDSIFQFQIKAIGIESGQLLAGINVHVTFMPPTDTTLGGVTDSSGVVVLSYKSLLDTDSLRYYLDYQPNGYYIGQTVSYIGKPEVITLGVLGK